VGKYPVVLIAPDDTDLVKEGSDARRKFFDSIISQLNRPYLEALIRYTHTLRQRNSLLKMMAEKNSVDPLMLESYDQVLEQAGHLIFEMRQEFIQTFLPVFRHFYRFIVADEEAGLEYRSELERISFLEGLAKNRQRDILLQRTNFGIHRDEYSFSLVQGDLKRLGSQGQQKSFIIALKLAHAEIVRTQKRISPILLLDDIFDKLDDFRIARLLELIRNDSLGQLFITDARPERTVDLLRNIGVPATIFTVQNGSIEQP
jgi:DNA replication and repair protein RecF